MAEEATFKCQCGGMVVARVPTPLFLNGSTASVVVFPHEKPSRCDRCRQAFVYTVNGITGVQGGFLAVDYPGGERDRASSAGVRPIEAAIEEAIK